MKNFEPSKKYTTIAVYAALVILFGVLLCFILLNLSVISSWFKSLNSILSPFIYGIIIAYLCNPLMNFFEKKVFTFIEKKKPHKRLLRALSITCAYLVLILIITIFISLVVPQVMNSYYDLQAKINDYIAAAQQWADHFVRTFPLFNGQYENFAEFFNVNEIANSLKEFITDSYSLLQSLTNYAIDYAGRFVIEIKNLLVGFIFSVYLLLSRELLKAQCKKIMAAFFSEKKCTSFYDLVGFTHQTFGGFIIGKLLDSLIIGLLTFVVLAFCKMPYYPLVSVIIGVTNVIPFFGPFIGAIPSAFIIFIADPGKALWFILIILIIQQLDGNIIGPKILGDSTGLSSLCVIVAITIFGGFFGITGMFLGVPAFAVMYALAKRYIEKRLAEKEMPLKTLDYYTPGDPVITGDAYNDLYAKKDEGGATQSKHKIVVKYGFIWDKLLAFFKKIFSKKNGK